MTIKRFGLGILAGLAILVGGTPVVHSTGDVAQPASPQVHSTGHSVQFLAGDDNPGPLAP